MNNASDANYTPLVSIITPSYNQGPYIDDTLSSVFKQTYKNIEHIILDSCSSDATEEIIQKYLNKYNVIYICEKDNGPAQAINRGMEIARGDIICWLNSDDYYFDSDVIEKVVRLFNKFPKVDVITADGYYVDDRGNFIVPISLPNSKCITYDYIKVRDFILQPSTFWRKNTLRLDHTLTYAFDWKFFCDFYRAGKSFLYVREYFSCYRIQAGSKTFTDTAERKYEILKILKENDVPSYVSAWGYFMYMTYFISEYLHISCIKRLARALDMFISRLSGLRISAS